MIVSVVTFVILGTRLESIVGVWGQIDRQSLSVSVCYLTLDGRLKRA